MLSLQTLPQTTLWRYFVEDEVGAIMFHLIIAPLFL